MKTQCDNCHTEATRLEDKMECQVCQLHICSSCFELDDEAPNTPLCLDCYALSRGAVMFLKAIERQADIINRLGKLLQDDILDRLTTSQ